MITDRPAEPLGPHTPHEPADTVPAPLLAGEDEDLIHDEPHIHRGLD
ncbi:hypothetical protein [Streptomyces sp. B21-083]